MCVKDILEQRVLVIQEFFEAQEEKIEKIGDGLEK